MKIPGSFFEIELRINRQLIEFQILKRGEIKYTATIMDFSEVAYDLKDVLEENEIFLPKNRLDLILNELEAKYLELADELQSIQKKQRARHRETAKKMFNIPKHTGKSYKILLTGGNGKTSIYKVIFEGILPHETKIFEPTEGIEKHLIDFPAFGLQNADNKLSLWETGADFPPESAFKDTSLLLFIIDAFNVEMYEEYRNHLHKAIKLVKKYGYRPDHLAINQSNFFCFIHKTDLFPNYEEKFKYLVNFFQKNPETGKNEEKINFYSTSIFDSSIYSAWTKVIETLMPKSSKLNELSSQLKQDLGLYASIIIERRTGLPICASKTLLDDSALIGNTNRLLITIEKVLSDFQLASLNGFKINTETGYLEIRIFDQYFILMMLYPLDVDLSTPQAEKRIQNFIEIMKNSI